MISVPGGKFIGFVVAVDILTGGAGWKFGWVLMTFNPDGLDWTFQKSGDFLDCCEVVCVVWLSAGVPDGWLG